MPGSDSSFFSFVLSLSLILKAYTRQIHCFNFFLFKISDLRTLKECKNGFVDTHLRKIEHETFVDRKQQKKITKITVVIDQRKKENETQVKR